MSDRQEIVFREVQWWRSTWFGLPVAVFGLALLGMFVYMLVVQVLLGHPIGNKPAPNAVLILIGGLMVVLGGALAFLGLLGRLTVEVRRDALYVRHYPLTREECISYTDLESCEACTYRPLLDYGGYGVRGWPGGRDRALNVRGNRGVRLVFTDGRRLLIGSGQAEDLAGAVLQMMSS